MRSFTEEERYSLWLFHTLLSNAAQYRRLVLYYDGPRGVFEAIAAGEHVTCISKTVEQRLRDAARLDEVERVTASLTCDGYGILFEGEDGYPELLGSISDPPPLLFYKGNPGKICTLPIGVVGSRRCTPYGREMAMSFSEELCAQGATVVSGLADGIDSCAAIGALKADVTHLPTVGVLGCGIDTVYPAGNGRLYESVAKDGLILSEYFPGEKPQKEYFPIRNRIISGMSKGLLVVEAAERSGTSITAGLALDQGRDVFAIPGRITDYTSAGTNRMIRDGEAKAVLNPGDILSEYDFERLAHIRPAFNPDTLTPDQRQVYDTLLTGEKSFDELAVLTGETVSILNSVLTELLFLGIIRQLPGRIYIVDLANNG